MTAAPTCDECVTLLNEALNITVRGQRLDRINRRDSQLAASCDGAAWQASGRFDAYVAMHNHHAPEYRQIETRSLTTQLWAEDQFDKDLSDWEKRARAHMIEAHQ